MCNTYQLVLSPIFLNTSHDYPVGVAATCSTPMTTNTGAIEYMHMLDIRQHHIFATDRHVVTTQCSASQLNVCCPLEASAA